MHFIHYFFVYFTTFFFLLVSTDMADLVIRKQKSYSYTAEFELKIISFVKESKNCAASCQFRVYEKFIHVWCKNKAKLENIPK